MHLQNKNESFGCYVCSCGYYYIVDPPGFPCTNRSANCPNCGKTIGGGPKVKLGKGIHGMAVRPGHYRIFKDQAQQKKQMAKYGDSDENIPNMTLDNYIKNIIEPIIEEKPSLGLTQSTKNI